MFADYDYGQRAAPFENCCELARALRIEVLCKYNWSRKRLMKRAHQGGKSPDTPSRGANHYEIVI
jgi:hypothetical protein